MIKMYDLKKLTHKNYTSKNYYVSLITELRLHI